MTAKELEYRGRKLIARQYANGWQIEIRPLQAGPIKHSVIFHELSEAIECGQEDRGRQPLNSGTLEGRT